MMTTTQRRKADLDRLARKAAETQARVADLKSKNRSTHTAESEALKADADWKRARLVLLLSEVRQARHESWAMDPTINMSAESCAPPDFEVITRDVNRMTLLDVERVLEHHQPSGPRYVW